VDEKGEPLCGNEGGHTHEAARIVRGRNPRSDLQGPELLIRGSEPLIVGSNEGEAINKTLREVCMSTGAPQQDEPCESPAVEGAEGGTEDLVGSRAIPTAEGTGNSGTEDLKGSTTVGGSGLKGRSEVQLGDGVGGSKRAVNPDGEIPGQAKNSSHVLEPVHSSADFDYETLRLHCKIADEGKLTGIDFKALQLNDEHIQELIETDKDIELQNGVYVRKMDNTYKPLLPRFLIKFLINSHHYTDPGIHKSRTRIRRDLTKVYAIGGVNLDQLIDDAITDCHICQIYSTNKPTHNYTNLPRFKSPRLSWSVDLVTDLPQSQNNFKLLLIAVDDFSNYMVTHPLINASTKSLIEAITQSIITPFGCPHYIRSDEQPGLYNSKEFFQFLSYHHIELLATAVASPFSNGRAETHIKIFKHSARKFFYQHKSIEKWDENLHFISNALNQSVNSFGFTPEEILFGYKVERDTGHLISTEGQTDEQIVKDIVDKAEKNREKYEVAKVKKETSNLTFKNSHGKINVKPGELVLHRQMQVSTGTSSKWKPQFTGPYIVNDVNKSLRTAMCQHSVTGRVVKAHFNNMVPYRYTPDTVRVPSSSDFKL